MDILEIIKVGLLNLALHPLRSFLTVLGIIFGVGAVVAMLSIAEGARFQAQQQIKMMGIENVRVLSKKVMVESKKKTSGRRRFSILKYGVTLKEYRHLCDTIEHLKASVAMRDLRQKVFWQDRSADSHVMGTSASYIDVTNHHVMRGRFITPLDEKLLNRVCVLGADARKQLFSYRNPIGEKIRVGNKWYEVVGLMEPKTVETGGMIEVRDVNKDIYVPLATALADFGTVSASAEIGSMEMIEVELDEIYFRMESSDYVEYAAALIKNYLNRNHPLHDFEVVVPKELLAQSEKQQEIFDIVMVSIASISLLVGGIGIMNIMLATVTERTREIGTRRAVGAQKADILMQFLFETVILAVTGGFIGVLLGAAGAWAIVQFAGWKAIVTWFSIVLSFSISALVGIVFGMYPAIKAANLSPIEALRYE